MHGCDFVSRLKLGCPVYPASKDFRTKTKMPRITMRIVPAPLSTAMASILPTSTSPYPGRSFPRRSLPRTPVAIQGIPRISVVFGYLGNQYQREQVILSWALVFPGWQPATLALTYFEVMYLDWKGTDVVLFVREAATLVTNGNIFFLKPVTMVVFPLPGN